MKRSLDRIIGDFFNSPLGLLVGVALAAGVVFTGAFTIEAIVRSDN